MKCYTVAVTAVRCSRADGPLCEKFVLILLVLSVWVLSWYSGTVCRVDISFASVTVTGVSGVVTSSVSAIL